MKPPHILVVDDEDDFRATLNILLSMEGIQVSEASSGAQAVKLIAEGLRPDLIMLDYRMPGLNGGQSLQNMRTQGLGAPALLVTAAGEAQDLARQHGFDAVLKKPFGQDTLLAILGKFLAPGSVA